MKCLVTCVLLLIVSLVSAQIVVIPDPAFKSYLVSQYDTNGNGEIELSESSVVTDLHIPDVLDVTGIQSFINVQNITGSGTHVTSLDISGMSQLVSLTFTDNQDITLINVSGCNNLRTMNCNSSNSSGEMNIIR